MFELELYASEDGKEPVAEFLDSLDQKMNAKLVGLMELLEEKGTALREPYSAPLEDGIFNFAASLEVILQGRFISSILGNGLWSRTALLRKRKRLHRER